MDTAYFCSWLMLYPVLLCKINFLEYFADMQNDRVYGKTSVELNREANSDIYRMFSNLDVSSKEKFVSSFTKAVDSFKNYYAGGEVVELAKKDAKNNVYMGNEFMNLRKSVTRYYNGTTGIT